MLTTYYFHLGKTPLLSLAEIENIFSTKFNEYELLNNEVLKISCGLRDDDFKQILEKLGGTRKISKHIQEIPRSSNLDFLILEIVKIIEMQNVSGKIKIGINLYNLNLPVHKIGMEIKKILKYKKISCRIVENGAKNLGSISIIRNKLTAEKGLDLNIIADSENINLSKTICCQNSIHYSKRDYGRPRRNAKVGMLPPKLAQMMLNLADLKNKSKVLDPFCGIGTVLQEGILMDLEMFGSDISEEMIQDTVENLNWLKELIHLDLENFSEKIKAGDAKNVSNLFPVHKFEAIVTEGTLGPAQKKTPEEKDVLPVIKELVSIYESFFEDVKRIIEKSGCVVITFPVFRTRKQLIYSSDYILPKLQDWESRQILNNDLINNLSLVKSKSSRLVYERNDQFVLREITVLKQREK